MPIQFQQVAPLKLNIDTGAVTDQSGQSVAPKPTPANIGMDTQEFHDQVMQLAQNKVPLEKALQAISAHTEITDKNSANSMAGAIYQIVGSK